MGDLYGAQLRFSLSGSDQGALTGLHIERCTLAGGSPGAKSVIVGDWAELFSEMTTADLQDVSSALTAELTGRS